LISDNNLGFSSFSVYLNLYFSDSVIKNHYATYRYLINVFVLSTST